MQARLVPAVALFALVVLLSFATNSLAQNEVASVFTFGHGAGSISASPTSVTTRFLAAFDGTVATADNFKIVIPRNGTLKNLYWSAAASTLTGTGHTITVLRNGVPTSLVATWNTTATSGNNTAISETVSAGQAISVRIQLGTGSGSMTRPTVAFEFLTPSSSVSQWITSGSDIYFLGGNVGIGTSSPTAKLDVAGDISFQNSKLYFAGAINPTYYMQYITSGGLKFKVNNNESLFLNVDGNVGIGTTTPVHPLHMASGAHVTAGGVWTNASSRERKENIQPLSSESAQQALITLNPVTFHYKADREEQYVGFIAEDVPDLVATKDRQGLATMDIVAVLTKVVQDQKDIIAQQQNAIYQIVATLKEHDIHVDFDFTGTSIGVLNTSTQKNQPLARLNSEALPDNYSLSSNYPNPFSASGTFDNPETRIQYALPQAGQVTIKIYDSLGREVRKLVDERKNAGYYNLMWDGKNEAQTSTVFFQIRN